jgi:hypothetical protein
MSMIIRNTITSNNSQGAQMRTWLYTNTTLTLRGSI